VFDSLYVTYCPGKMISKVGMANLIYGFYKAIVVPPINPFEFDLLSAIVNGITNKEISIVNLLRRR
jgi:hypothetical protein